MRSVWVLLLFGSLITYHCFTTVSGEGVPSTDPQPSFDQCKPYVDAALKTGTPETSSTPSAQDTPPTKDEDSGEDTAEQDSKEGDGDGDSQEGDNDSANTGETEEESKEDGGDSESQEQGDEAKTAEEESEEGDDAESTEEQVDETKEDDDESTENSDGQNSDENKSETSDADTAEADGESQEDGDSKQESPEDDEDTEESQQDGQTESKESNEEESNEDNDDSKQGDSQEKDDNQSEDDDGSESQEVKEDTNETQSDESTEGTEETKSEEDKAEDGNDSTNDGDDTAEDSGEEGQSDSGAVSDNVADETNESQSAEDEETQETQEDQDSTENASATESEAAVSGEDGESESEEEGKSAEQDDSQAKSDEDSEGKSEEEGDAKSGEDDGKSTEDDTKEDDGKSTEEDTKEDDGKSEEDTKEDDGKSGEDSKEDDGKSGEDSKEDDGKSGEDSKEDGGKSEEDTKEDGKSEEDNKEDDGKSEEDTKEDDGKSEEDTKEDDGKSEEDTKEDGSESEEGAVTEETTKSEEGADGSKSEEDQSNEETAENDDDESGEDEDEDDKALPYEPRSRDHITEILRLDDSENTKTTSTLLEQATQITLKDLKRIYENAIKPLETLYKYRDLSNRHFGDPEIFSKPLVVFMGPWSGGKSTIINWLLGIQNEETALRTGADPSPAQFNIMMYGKEDEIMDGTQLAADWTFSGLQKFGQSFLDRLRGRRLPNRLLEKVNIVEIPGILEVRKQVERSFPFNDACQWFIDRADVLFLVYDPAKLDIGPETEAILDQLKGRENQVRIILNKADTVKPEELLRVQATLVWNISPLMSSAEPPVMYAASLWDRPLQPDTPKSLLTTHENNFLKDIRDGIEKRVESRIAAARRFAVRVRNHAKMVDCYLNTYNNHRSFFSDKKKVSNDIIDHPQNYHIYEGLSTLTNISRYDLPDPDTYRDFFKLNHLWEFPTLSSTCSYFKGCPINKLDIAIAYELPEVLGKFRRQREAILTAQAQQSTTSSK